jgi:hypothetical protein
MKVDPASPDQRVPSQSNTAMRGWRAWTRAWKSAVVRVRLAGKNGLRRRWLLRIVEQLVAAEDNGSVQPRAMSEVSAEQKRQRQKRVQYR